MLSEPETEMRREARIPEGSELLITSIRTGNTEIFSVDLNLGDMRNLTRSPKSENRYPIWSPDGSRVAFTSNRDVPESWNLYVMDANGENVRRLTDIEAKAVCYFPTWTQDLIYFGYAPGDGAEASIMRVRADGSGLERIGPGRDPAISSDGKTIAFTQHTGGGYCLFTMYQDGGSLCQLTTHENRIGAVTPAWSPDDGKLVFSDEVNGKLELFQFDFNTGRRHQITDLQQFSASAAWSSDGRHITFRVTDYDYWNYPEAKEYVYREKKPDKRPVWIMEADGARPRVIESLRYHCALDGSRPVWRPRRIS